MDKRGRWSQFRPILLILIAASFVALADPAAAWAHVKWFSNYDWSTPPKTLPELLTPTFWSMLALSVVTLLALVAIDKRIDELPSAKRLNRWLESKADSSLLVMRFAAFATLLVAWQQETLFAPDLPLANPQLGWFQFTILVLLLWEPTTTFAGVGLAAVWFYGANQFGLFHMLDYVNTLGAAYFLMVRPLNHRLLRASALPVLYATVGFALMWLGSEKLVYPQWALYLLQQNPVLTLGLDPSFFLVAAAFIELSLGFLLIICLLSRPLSITITLVFFLTTCVFGKLEIIGHTLIHAALIVFLFEGPGRSFTPPIAFHRTLPLRLAFAGVNYVLAIFLVLLAYTSAACNVQVENVQHHHHEQYVLQDGEPVPQVRLLVEKDAKSGWNVQLVTENIEFRPEHASGDHVQGEGHAHLYLDGQKIARVYSHWLHLEDFPPGEHTLRVTLNTNDHREYATADGPIAAEVTIQQE